jgi:hypothetical protein
MDTVELFIDTAPALRLRKALVVARYPGCALSSSAAAVRSW